MMSACHQLEKPNYNYSYVTNGSFLKSSEFLEVLKV